MTRKKGKIKPRKRDDRRQPQPAKTAEPPIAVPSINNGKSNSNGGAANDKESHDVPDRKTVEIERWLAIAVAAATVVQAIFAVFQWTAMSDQLGLMAVDQRPWISIETSVTEDDTQEWPYLCTITAKNSGKTVGTIYKQSGSVLFLADGARSNVATVEKIAGRIDITLGNDVITVLEKSPSQLQTSVSMIPAQEFPFDFSNLYPELSDLNIREMRDRKAICIILCYIEYKGLDGQKYSTRSCYTYDTATRKCMPAMNYSKAT